jgi:transposase-like protein
VQPDTLLRWHRQLFRGYWRRKSRATAPAHRPPLASETVALIKELAVANRLWGTERIRGEILKLDIRVARSTIQRYLREACPTRRAGQPWATFLRNHAGDIWACDFLPVLDVLFRSLDAFFIVELASCRVVHVGVTRHPADAWAAQQLREFAPVYEDAARHFRRAIGSSRSVDETYTKIAGKPAYIYRAIDGHGQVVHVYVSQRSVAADPATFFRRAIAATGVIPDEVTTDGAAAYPPALAAALPPVVHETGKRVEQRIERDHQHLKGRMRGMREFKTLAGARVLCRAHAFLRNLRGEFYDLGRWVDAVALSPQPWAALTSTLLGR